ncbi:MAG TPA: NAD(P)-dependent oxidoreductase [Candidatus Limiplasma sp.]|nr:NAD(P)-dependent oxidoreductase [Candidatus Limiplasma sp.]HRX08556.1 NAD(P)-dependent oxidoreductase [Candidatus Limiplasma sp.]
MNVLIIGGTGLLGSQAARELISRGHTVAGLALPPVMGDTPPEMQLSFGSYLEMTDDELIKLLDDCEGLVFAAGVDERVEGPPPIYDFFKKFNITPLERILRLAKQAGIRRAVICGSYFSYFDRLWPELELARWHPYIKSRRDQEAVALSFADDHFAVSILELPYIFGAQPGRKPVWVFLVEYLRKMKPVAVYPGGGTAMVTVRQVGQAIAGALERGTGGTRYPIGYDNLTWKEMLKIFYKYMGQPNKKIITIPTFLFALFSRRLLKQRQQQGIEGGLNLAKFPALQTRNQFIDKSLGCEPLGVTPDDIDQAIGQSVRLSLDVLDGKTEAVGMKAE